MSYTEGAHESPADTRNRLVRVGSKYQASTPSVADGDNTYLLVDAAGRPLIAGAAAHDAPAVGNPVRIGGVYRTTLPTVATGDMVDLLLDTAGRLQLACQADTFKIIDAVAIVAGTPAVVWTPAAGKTVRLLGWVLSSSAGAALEFQDSGTDLNDASMTTTKTTIAVDDGTQFAIGQTIMIGNEQMLITNISTNNLTCTRALNGTTASAHADNSDVYILRWPASIERATLIQTARIWTRAADFEPFFVDADVDTDVRLLLDTYRRLAT